ncbi:DNRLRE domain-containing protein [Planctomycetota bacterium]
MKKSLLVVLALLMFSVSANADMVTISGDGSAHSTWLHSGLPTNNFGGNSTFRVDGGGGSDPIGRGLLKFDGVPLGAVIDSAMLTLRTNNAETGSEDGKTDATISVHRVIENVNTMWSEGAVTWDTFGTVAGGQSGVDYDAVANGSIAPEIFHNTAYSIDVKSLVQEWSDGVANQGVAILASNTNGVSFFSDESGFSPQLKITYTAVPEPTAFLMLGLVGVGFGGTRWWKSRKTEK